MTPTNSIIKTSLIFILFLTIITTSFSQTNHRFEVLLSNGYTNFIRKFYKPEGSFKGSYGYGLAFRYRLGNEGKLFHTKIGFAYSNVSQKRIVKNSQTYLWDFQEVIHYQIISIPYHLVLEKNNWRGGLQVAFETPFYRNEVTRSMSSSGNLGRRERSGNRTRIFVHWGFGFGAFLGKTLKTKNGKMFFIEGEFKAFDVIRPLEAHDEYLMENIFPYWIGLNIGIGF